MSSSVFSRVPPVALLLALVFTGSARAQDQDAIRKMIELNRQALASYEAKDFEAAKASLLDAVVMGKEAGLTSDKMMARTYVHLGAVYIEGLKDRAKGIRYFGLALRIRPDINITPSLVTPALKQAFDEAKKDPQAAAATAPVAAKPAPPPPKPAPPPPAPKPVAAAPKPVPPPAPAPEPEPAPPKPEPDTSNDEPDLPANFPTPLTCPNADEAPPGEPIVMRCVPSPSISVTKVLLFYRLPGGEQFSQVKASRSPKGWYIGTIPGDAVTGKSLQYYFEARDAGDKEVASNGRNDSPNLMLIREGAPPVGRGALAGLRFQSGSHRSSDEENPLEVQEHERVRATREVGMHRRRAGSIYVGVSVGSGYGYHPASRLEYRTDLQIGAGLSSVGVVHFAPEVGYQISDALSVSVMGRFQYIPAEGTISGGGAPAKGANSILGKLSYGLGEHNFQVLLSLLAGGGEGVRFQVPPKPTHDPKTSLPSNDTVRAGPFIFGPAVGLLFHFTPRFAWMVDGKGLFGVPDQGYAIEFSTGPQVGF
jgi:hypothetical protein